MTTYWQTLEASPGRFTEIAGLPGVRREVIPLHRDSRGSLHALYRTDEIPPAFQPVMACSSWSQPGVTRGPHRHVGQNDDFTFAGPGRREPVDEIRHELDPRSPYRFPDL